MCNTGINDEAYMNREPINRRVLQEMCATKGCKIYKKLLTDGGQYTDFTWTHFKT